jgi:hypothetical protein
MVVAGSGGPSVVLDAVAEFLESGTRSRQIHGDVALPGLSIRLLAGSGVLAQEVLDLCKLALFLEPPRPRLSKREKKRYL